MLEISVAMMVMLVGVMALSITGLRVDSLDLNNDERSAAENALRSMAEQITSRSEDQVGVAGGWSVVMTDMLSAGGAIGNTFDVRGLAPVTNAPSVGEIVVITDETLTDRQLGIDLGMPRDLDGDGLADNTDVSATATLLPVILRVTWRGTQRQRTFERGFFLLGI